MANHASRNWRGWVYAILVAAVLCCSLYYGEIWIKQQNVQAIRPERTTKHTAASTVSVPIATEQLPVILQESLEDARNAWVEYRSEPAMSIAMAIEPNTSAQLLAPQPANDLLIAQDPIPTNDSIFEGTSDPTLHEVSSTKEVTTPTYVSKRTIADASDAGNSWPRPTVLIDQLQHLTVDAKTNDQGTIASWSMDCSKILEELAKLESISSKESGEQIDRLRKMAEHSLTQKAPAGVSRELISLQNRAAYAILRRTAVWQAAYDCIKGNASEADLAEVRVDFSNLASSVKDVRKLVSQTGDVNGWNTYLMLDDLEKISKSISTDADATAKTARVFLSRVSWQRATDAQRSMLATEPVQKLAKRLHPLAYGPVDYRQLLIDLETLESDPIHRCRTSVAQQTQSLRYASQEAQVRLSDTINTYYRNANLRIAVSEELLQRCMPKSQTIERPVRTRILGADTRGASQVQTKLALDLVPDKHAWNIALKLSGDVQSATRSSKGPATFYNDSLAMIDSTRHLRVDVRGMSIKNGADTQVAAHDSLRGFDTDFDKLPLLGDLLRGVVRQQFDSERGIAQRIMKRTIADQTDTEFDKQLNKQVSEAEKQFQGKLLGPLDRMELNPLVVDLETTETRLIARYRIAGASQMAAHTPRPFAPMDSHMSIQIHESAINNAIEKLNLPGRKWTLPELGAQLAEALQQKDWVMSEDVPAGILIAFAPYRPVTVELLDGKMRITLRITHFEQEGGLVLKNFIVCADYAPNVEGMMAQLVKQGPISVDGPRLNIRDRLPIRTIFTRVFSARPILPLLTEDLIDDPRAVGMAISQLEIRDGWLAIAASSESSPHVAYIRSQYQQTR